jgi:hypothetical protein
LSIPIIRPDSIFFAALLPLAACSQIKTITWREEVQLFNGQVVIAERTADFRNVYAGGGDNGYFFQHERIKVTLPSLNKEVTWDGGLEPLAIDIQKNGDIYLVAIIENPQGRNEYSVQRGDHVAFKYSVDGKWTRISVDTVPRDIHPNLLIDRVSLFIKHGYPASTVVDLALKEKLNSEIYTESYKSWTRK